MKEDFLLWGITDQETIHHILDDRGRERGESRDPGGADDGAHQGASDVCRGYNSKIVLSFLLFKPRTHHFSYK